MNFASRLQEFGEQTALILPDGTRHSYQELAAQADAIYRLSDAPSIARTLIAVECGNVFTSVAAYLGALRNGYPVLLVDEQLSPTLREQLYQRYCVTSIWNIAGQWRHRSCENPATHPDLALLLSTSGSTGSPKLVKLTLANVQANAMSIARYLDITCDERPITTLPMHYSYGLSVLNSHLAVGATVLLTSESVTSKQFWDFFREHEASSIAGVPTIYAMLRQLRFERMALPSLKTMTQAGGKIAPELARWFGELAASRNQRFFVMYGQTEATARMSYVPSERLLDKIGSIGIAIPGGAIDLVADDMNPITESGTVGQLRYSGPNVMMGYAEDVSDLALPDVQQGHLLTGDLAVRDDDGYFTLHGRLKRFIKVFGNRIGLDEVEAQLREKGFDVAVTGRDELLVIAVRNSQPNQQDQEALITEASSSYRLHHSAIRVMAVESFPMSSAGKIQYAELLNALVP